MVKGLIAFHEFDLFGIQEGFHHQITDILELGDYAYVGSGRDDGLSAGEHSAIIYKKIDLRFWTTVISGSPRHLMYGKRMGCHLL